MDQLRTALNWLKQYHFWVLTCLVALIALFCWWSASKTMSALYDTSQRTIAGAFSNIQQVHSTPFHANDVINERQTAENKKQAESVLKLWQALYDRQRAQVLKWPAALSKEFVDAVERMQFNDEIPSELRNNYQNYIEQHFPKLPEQIGARPLDETSVNGLGGPGAPGKLGYGPEGVPGAMPGADGMPDDNYICEWQDQSVIRDELNFPLRPSSLRIWVTQEDLWVYHALLDVIAKTNQAAGATRQRNAAVKIVFSLEVGQRAAQYSHQQGRLAVEPATATPGVGPGGPEGPRGVPGGPGSISVPVPGGPRMDGEMGAAWAAHSAEGRAATYK